MDDKLIPEFTPVQKRIVEAHFEAKRNWSQFSCDDFEEPEELTGFLLNGNTSKKLFIEFEMRYVPLFDIILCDVLGIHTKKYISGIKCGFKLLFEKLNIK